MQAVPWPVADSVILMVRSRTVTVAAAARQGLGRTDVLVGSVVVAVVEVGVVVVAEVGVVTAAEVGVVTVVDVDVVPVLEVGAETEIVTACEAPVANELVALTAKW